MFELNRSSSHWNTTFRNPKVLLNMSYFCIVIRSNKSEMHHLMVCLAGGLLLIFAYMEVISMLSCPNSLRSKIPDPLPREIEGKPFSNPPTDPLHPHTVQPRTKVGGHDAMSMHPQARSQSERPDPSGASRTGGAPLRKFTGTSLPNSKVSDSHR